MPFSNHWTFFVEDILGVNAHYYNSRDEIVFGILKIRECYIEILKKINCTEIIIWTDAYYKTEGLIFSPEFKSGKSLGEIKKRMETLDGIKIIPFMDAINQRIKITSNKPDYLDIVFIDEF